MDMSLHKRLLKIIKKIVLREVMQMQDVVIFEEVDENKFNIISKWKRCKISFRSSWHFHDTFFFLNVLQHEI
jgi:hypothetical protein